MNIRQFIPTGIGGVDLLARSSLALPSGTHEPRIWPKFMTVVSMLQGLTSPMLSTGASSDVMKRIGAPVLGATFTFFLLELIAYSPFYEISLGRDAASKGNSNPRGKCLLGTGSRTRQEAGVRDDRPEPERDLNVC